MVKVAGADVPPPGAGVITVTLAVPVAAISAAEMAAVNSTECTYVVVRGDPFQSTVELV